MQKSLPETKLQFKHYIPVFLFCCFSGNPLFTTGPLSKPFLILISILFTIVVISKYKYQFPIYNIFLRLIMLCCIIIILSLAQYANFNFVSYPGVFALILKIYLCILMFIYYKIIKKDFFELYIKLLATLVVLSIPFFFLNYIIHIGIQLDNPQLKSLFFYTSFDFPAKDIRNSGMFWEPGAFAGYLNMGLVFVILKNKSFKVGIYKNFVYIIVFGILTTMSTMGYLVLSIIGFFYIVQNFSFGKFIILPIFFIASYLAYFNVDFLSKKVNSQLTEANNMSRSDISNQRFGAINMDLRYIRSQPITGNGLSYITRYRYHPWIKKDIGHGNGMSNYIVWWGIPFFIIWLFSVFFFFKRSYISTFNSLAITFIILLILQGEQFLNYPLFLSFYILPSFLKKEQKYRINLKTDVH